MKKIKIQRAYTVNPENREEKTLKSEIHYDISSNIILSESYSSAGDFESKIVSKFDEKSNLLEEINYLDKTEIAEHVFFSRDENGKILESRIQYNDGSQSVKKYNRETNNELLIEQFDEDGDLESKEILKYDDNENLIEKTKIDDFGNIEEKQVNIFDESNRITERFEYGYEEEFRLHYKLEYNDKGNPVQQLSMNQKGELVEKLVLEYDEKDRVISQNLNNKFVSEFIFDDENNTKKEIRKGGHIVDYEIITRYNEDNLLLEEEDFESLVIYEYEFFD